jgi:hypothetical protein
VDLSSLLLSLLEKNRRRNNIDAKPVIEIAPTMGC